MSRKKTPEELSLEGKKCLEKGDFRVAERLFARALAAEDHPAHRNNLATVLFYAGELERALAVLEPYLEDGDPLKVNPYSYALASRIHSARGEKEKARVRLTEAVQKYEELRLAARGRLSPPEERNIREYTVIIMEAAADLEDHRLVFELYRRWETDHVSYQNKHLAAVACFNLGRYKRAAGLWASIGHVHDIYSHLQGIALLAEQGTIPPFTLAYDLPNPEKVINMLRKAGVAPEEQEHLFMHSHVRLFSLIMLLQRENPAENTYAAYHLVFFGGEWGKKLGFSILNSPVFSTEAKMGAAQALMARGILKEGDPVPMYVEGERRLVQLVTSEAVLHYDQKLHELVRRARALRKAGKLDEAIELLEDLWVKKKKLYPPALLELAECLCHQRKHQEARRIMDILKDILPDNPVTLYNSCVLHLEMGNAAAAREDLDALKELDREALEELGKDYQEQLALLETKVGLAERIELLSNPSIIEGVVQYVEEEEKRREVEEKPLSIDVPLSRGLKNMPVHWLEAALLSFGLAPARIRREKERQLKEFLSNRENLARVVQALEEKEKELLEYLLARGGFSRLNAVTRKFGSMEGDGFFWNEKPPSSPLGVLWSRALVMVGKAVLEGRNCRVAVIPADLRPLLREILAHSAGPASFSKST
ncbi:tetratricopeptide repeat protein [Desulfovirgula thermocuniculi]|uniref:tetratricopeptide repeat protein n=1 Tax=Desulfovirgula thermocuniculi TaxID=348842 RepID=UPI001B7F9947|nr:tetratricopeptide repeat protein [Desulfovirgula thermocuniculi]